VGELWKLVEVDSWGGHRDRWWYLLVLWPSTDWVWLTRLLIC
jgi:hypothetical protein